MPCINDTAEALALGLKPSVFTAVSCLLPGIFADAATLKCKRLHGAGGLYRNHYTARYHTLQFEGFSYSHRPTKGLRFEWCWQRDSGFDRLCLGNVCAYPSPCFNRFH